MNYIYTLLIFLIKELVKEKKKLLPRLFILFVREFE